MAKIYRAQLIRVLILLMICVDPLLDHYSKFGNKDV